VFATQCVVTSSLIYLLTPTMCFRIKPAQVKMTLTSRRNPICKPILKRCSGFGKASPCSMAAKRKPIKVRNTKRETKNTTARTGIKDSPKKQIDYCSKSLEADGKSDLQNDDRFLIPLAERVKLRRMTSQRHHSSSRKLLSTSASNGASMHKLTQQLSIGLTRLPEGRPSRRGKMHASVISSRTSVALGEYGKQQVNNADLSKPCQVSVENDDKTTLRRRLRQPTLANQRTLKMNATSSVVTIAAANVVSGQSNDRKADIKSVDLLESFSVQVLKTIARPTLDKASDMPVAVSRTRHTSAVLFPGNKLRRMKSTLRVHDLKKSTTEKGERSIAGDETTSDELSSSTDCFEECRLLRNRKCQMPCLKSTVLTPYGVGSKCEVMPKLRQVKTKASRLPSCQNKGDRWDKDVPQQDDHTSMSAQSEAKLVVSEVTEVAVENTDGNLSESMPTLTAAFSNAAAHNISTTRDYQDGQAMPLLEPSSTERVLVENFLPQLAIGSKRLSDDNGSLEAGAKSIKFDVSSPGEQSFIALPERDKFSSKRTPRKRHAVEKALSVAVVETTKEVLITASNNDFDRCMESKVVHGPLDVSSESVHRPIMGVDQGHFIPREAPMVMRWHPLLGSYFPNTFSPQQLPRGGQPPVLRHSGFGMLSSPPVKVTSSTEVHNPVGFLNCTDLNVSTSLPIFWSPVGTPVLPQMDTALPMNIARTMLATPTSLYPGSAIGPVHSSNRSSMANPIQTFSMGSAPKNFFPSSSDK